MNQDAGQVDPTSNNRRRLHCPSACNCCYCLEAFPSDGILHWIDEGQTALCPRCGVDAVLIGGTDAATLLRMHDERFGANTVRTLTSAE